MLGALFSSKAYQKNETDLVIIVTPHIVQPIRPGQPIKTPLDNTLPPNDVDLFLNGKGEIARKDIAGAVFRNSPFVGHMLDLPKGRHPCIDCAKMKIARIAALGVLIAGTALAGCSDIYYDRRETVARRRRRRGGVQHGGTDGRSVAARRRQPATSR